MHMSVFLLMQHLVAVMAESKDMEMSSLVPSTSTNVHGKFVGTVSPVKTGKSNTKVKYFEGQLSDGPKTMRFISFEPNLRWQIEEPQEKSSAVQLRNCAVKRKRSKVKLIKCGNCSVANVIFKINNIKLLCFS